MLAARAASPPRSSCWARSSPPPSSASAAIRPFRLSSRPACAASHRPARAERRARPRQPHARHARDRHRHLVREDQVSRWPSCGQGPLHRQSGARSVHRSAGAELSARRAATAALAPGVRRQPGRALLLRCRAAGSRAAAGRDPRPPAASCSNAARRIWTAVEAAYRRSRRRARELAAFFANLPEEMAKAHLVIARAGASTVAELDGHRPAVDPGAAAARSRQRSAQERDAACRIRGAWCIEQKDLSPERLRRRDRGLWRNTPERLAQAAAAAKRLGRPDAVGAPGRSRRGADGAPATQHTGIGVPAYELRAGTGAGVGLQCRA